ncbi:hypothetical protein M885DRAFT_527770 [Pelagophyceae sp. CCMP2097]|nr:hypothetical protein M885DRAFT_527770 [Pelagophyceae sp. CCMP2097]
MVARVDALVKPHSKACRKPLVNRSYLPYVPYTIPPLPAQAGLPVCDASTIVSVIYNDVLDEAHNLVAFSEADIEAGAEPVIIAVGASDKAGVRLCGGGMAIFGLEDPMVPEYLGCFGTRYTHDAQCVLYHGPDKRFTGRQLCFLSNTNEISVVDITDKNELELISTVWGCDSGQKYYAQNPYPYLGNPIAACDPMFPIEMETPGGPYKSWHPAFVHQGWLSEDHSRFVMGDEVDEETGVVATVSTYYFDVSSLLTLKYEGIHASDYIGVDHNLYIDGKLSYHADYTAGMRVRTTDFAKGTKEVGFFDVAPDYITGYTDGEIGNGVADVLPSEGEFIWLGSWSLYPFFASGVVAVSSVDRGLFLLKYTGKK